MAVVNGAELARLYVDPRLHRRGVGRRLFEDAEDMVRANGFTEMRVGALVESAAAFYRSMGMREVEKVEWEPEIFGDRQVTILTKSL
jgi:GNAT superfamily N-acetyltransferase